MTYTNSDLVSYTKLSPCNSGLRKHSIDRISPHCFVGQVTVERIGRAFESINKNASCNYGIGLDGRVALIVEEKNRSWCTSSPENDHRAITIECASDNKTPYAFKDEVFDTLCKLSADICRRNGKNKLVWISDKAKALSYNPAPNEMLITVHRWYARKACPGDWLMNNMQKYADTVNNLLINSTEDNSKPAPVDPAPKYRVQTGSYSKEANAIRQRDELRVKGFDAYTTHYINKFRTQVGEFSNKTQADELAKKLQSAGYKTYITFTPRGDDVK